MHASSTTADGLVQYGSREGAVAQAPALVLNSTNFSALSATQSFWVTVWPPAPPEMTAVGWSNGQFTLSITGDAGPDYSILVSTDLVDWTLAATSNAPALPWVWADPNTNRWPQRYYRIELGP